MPTFKVSINSRSYYNGCADEFVEQKCYAIDIYGSDSRIRQRNRVQIGDILYMVKGNILWEGDVTSQWRQYNLVGGQLNPDGFWVYVEAKRNLRNQDSQEALTDEWVCDVNWSRPMTLSAATKSWLNMGFNAVTIKPV